MDLKTIRKIENDIDLKNELRVKRDYILGYILNTIDKSVIMKTIKIDKIFYGFKSYPEFVYFQNSSINKLNYEIIDELYTIVELININNMTFFFFNKNGQIMTI